MALAGAAQKYALGALGRFDSSEIAVSEGPPPGFLSLAGNEKPRDPPPSCESIRTGIKAAPGNRPREVGGAELKKAPGVRDGRPRQAVGPRLQSRPFAHDCVG
jgi:hypothetical protein